MKEPTILGRSEAAARMREFCDRAAGVDASVLLTGETGTGKGLLAKRIHACSRRRAMPMVVVNCAGVPESLFESEFFGHRRGAFTGADRDRGGLLAHADGGTLFLDEVGELTLSCQAKLLTALEEGEVRPLGTSAARRVDVRIVAATCADLRSRVAEGRFRRDLYHRLVILTCTLAPLRERRGDIPYLARHFLAVHAGRYGRGELRLTGDAIARLRRHEWPGNVRELDHAVEAAVVRSSGRAVTATDVAASLIAAPAGTGAGGGVRRYSFRGSPDQERRAIVEALREARGNRTRAAKALGMSRATLRNRIRRFGLE